MFVLYNPSDMFFRNVSFQPLLFAGRFFMVTILMDFSSL